MTDQLLDEALAWHRALDADDANWDGFTLWLEADPRHRQAFDEIALIDRVIEDHRDRLKQVVEPATLSDRPGWFRRRGLLGGSMAAALALAIGVPTLWPATADVVYATGGGETRSIQLAGGTSIDLAPSSRLIVKENDPARLELAKGEAYFAVAHDPRRILSIRAGSYAVTDIGTKFAMNFSGEMLSVGVSEGHVAVSRGGSQRTTLAAGEQLIARNDASSVRHSPIAAKDVGSWRRGRLVYNDAPLSIVAADITRYSGKTIILDPSLRQTRFSGVLAIGDGSTLLPSLASLMALSYQVDGNRIASALLALANGPPALARDIAYRIDLPAGPIGSGLAALSQATGISVGLAGELPQFRTRPLHGSLTAAEALDRLLAGSGLIAVRVAPSAFRIEHIHRGAEIRPVVPAQPAPAVEDARPLFDIVVTGQKRQQNLDQVPMSVSVITPGGSAPSGVTAGSRDVSLSSDGFALTNLGPGRNRQFIRGVADSPFGGNSQSTVAVQLDEARVIFDAPDPDLRLVDMERVEILKGPQGPLYGTGALGGIYHLVTRKPQLNRTGGALRLLTEGVEHGGIGYGGEAVVNLPLVTDRLALRGVAYGVRAAGWIDNEGGKHDSNVSRNYGGRLALRWQPGPGWTVDVGGVMQYLNVANSQYVTRSDDTLIRDRQIREPTDNDFREVSATVQGEVGGLKLVSATSFIDHDVNYTLDASAAAAQFGMTGQVTFHDHRGYSIFNQEIRIGPQIGGRWVAGLSYMRAHSHSQADVVDSGGTRLPVQTLDRVVTEYAAFGEGTVGILPRVDATGGVRLYRTVAQDEAIEPANGRDQRLGKTAIAPSLSLSWHPRGDGIVYLRYARALRPGGLAADGDTGPQRFRSDELGTFDLGIRHAPANQPFTFAASLFYSRWKHIQSDYLLPNGLISTRNAGRGRIFGGEVSAEWRVMRGLRLAAGFSLQDARLTHSEQGVDLDKRHLPIAPNMTGRMTVNYDFALGRWTASLAAQGNYIGRAHLALDDNLDRSMGKYAVFSTSASLVRDRFTLAARIDNLFDVKGDSFAFGNPFSIMAGRQYTPLRPRAFTVSIARSW